MILSKRPDIERFLARPEPPIRAAVIYGRDTGVVRDRGLQLARKLVPNLDDPFDVALPGMLGLEQALAVVKELMVDTGRMDWATLVERMSATPARIGRLAHQGRPIAVGEPANLVLVDPTRRATVDKNTSASRSRNNPYHGRELPDPVELTVWAGRITYRR